SSDLIGVTTYGTVPSSHAQASVCACAGSTSASATRTSLFNMEAKAIKDLHIIVGRIAAHARVAQWIEQPPPKGQVGRSIRLPGAKQIPRCFSVLGAMTYYLCVRSVTG